MIVCKEPISGTRSSVTAGLEGNTFINSEIEFMDGTKGY